MFAKLKYLPLSLSPWSVSIHTPFGWKALNVSYRKPEKPLETVLHLNALSGRAPVPSPGECVNCLLFPYEEK